MNSKTLRSAETWTEIARLFARLALGASFLCCGRSFWLIGTYGAKNVPWKFRSFRGLTGAVTSLFPSSSTVSFAWEGNVAETLLGILLIAGFKIRMASVLSGLLLLSFAIGIVKFGIRRHSTIRSSRQPLQHSYWRSGSLTDSRWTSF